MSLKYKISEIFEFMIKVIIFVFIVLTLFYIYSQLDFHVKTKNQAGNFIFPQKFSQTNSEGKAQNKAQNVSRIQLHESREVKILKHKETSAVIFLKKIDLSRSGLRKSSKAVQSGFFDAVKGQLKLSNPEKVFCHSPLKLILLNAEKITTQAISRTR